MSDRDFDREARELFGIVGGFVTALSGREVESLARVAARLQADAERLATYHETCRELHAKIRDLESQLATAREDSERLDWLEERHAQSVGSVTHLLFVPYRRPSVTTCTSTAGALR